MIINNLVTYPFNLTIMKKIKLIIINTFLIASLLIPVLTTASAIDENFNPNNIISDKDLLDYSSMSLADIQKFLENNNSYLATYSTVNTHGDIKTAAEIIYDASYNNYDCEGIKLSDNPSEREKQTKCRKITTVNPKFLLLLLQKEQSLIEESNPSQRQLDWATGYGCPDGASCNPYWQGFGKQVNSAALQFLWYLKAPHQYSYRQGNTYSFSNPYGTISTAKVTVTPENQATAALYNYTPHVYNGNYNVYKLWKRYFPPKVYPNGTLLRAKGELGVWLIENGSKRPFVSKVALSSRFDENKIIEVSASDLNAYSSGSPIKFANYALVRSPKGELYLLVDNKKRPFASSEAFKHIGYNPEEVSNASWEDISSYKDGTPITIASAYPTGALLQNNKTGGVYFVSEGEKAPILDKSFLSTKFKNKKIIAVNPEELDKYTNIDPIVFEGGELLKTSASPAVYLIDNGYKRPFLSGEDFISLGYKWSNIITTSPQVLYLYPLGEAVNSK